MYRVNSAGGNHICMSMTKKERKEKKHSQQKESYRAVRLVTKGQFSCKIQEKSIKAKQHI